ncbi:hypothetical protein [Methylobacterium sp. E-066]|uniref:hypothetical protein n=1 Tax=Methylobacterium sp. E-066 TaxID=2836584 RepID=UPI001FB8704F|nr:hypothetical protein [Methylobacterium sp. E-066]MCJ2139904.1 hypothetical protein [Methylobacterium sp. E-066]
MPIDLKSFGLAKPGTVFLPTDEPRGRIEATIGPRLSAFFLGPCRPGRSFPRLERGSA